MSDALDSARERKPVHDAVVPSVECDDIARTSLPRAALASPARALVACAPPLRQALARQLHAAGGNAAVVRVTGGHATAERGRRG